jgi:hypothetical protein
LQYCAGTNTTHRYGSDTAVKILAEAHFLRSWYYFSLVNIFGDVPVILEPKNADELQIPQTAVAEIFVDVIENDLKNSITGLPAGYTGADVGRVTSGAAVALLARPTCIKINGTVRQPLPVLSYPAACTI